MSRAGWPGRLRRVLPALALTLFLAGCGGGDPPPALPDSAPDQTAAPFVSDSLPPKDADGAQPEGGGSGSRKDAPQGADEPGAAGFAATQEEESAVLYIQIGDKTLTAALEQNPSARALAALLEEGPVTIEAENFGGFEKVGALPQALPRSDVQTTAQPGDVMLYQGDSIVLFYGSNSWAYTKLGRITDTAGLEEALSGDETSLTLSLEP